MLCGWDLYNTALGTRSHHSDIDRSHDASSPPFIHPHVSEFRQVLKRVFVGVLLGTRFLSVNDQGNQGT